MTTKNLFKTTPPQLLMASRGKLLRAIENVSKKAKNIKNQQNHASVKKQYDNLYTLYTNSKPFFRKQEQKDLEKQLKNIKQHIKKTNLSVVPQKKRSLKNKITRQKREVNHTAVAKKLNLYLSNLETAINHFESEATGRIPLFSTGYGKIVKKNILPKFKTTPKGLRWNGLNNSQSVRVVTMPPKKFLNTIMALHESLKSLYAIFQRDVVENRAYNYTSEKMITIGTKLKKLYYLYASWVDVPEKKRALLQSVYKEFRKRFDSNLTRKV
jgi:hypothetical protein